MITVSITTPGTHISQDFNYLFARHYAKPLTWILCCNPNKYGQTYARWDENIFGPAIMIENLENQHNLKMKSESHVDLFNGANDTILSISFDSEADEAEFILKYIN